MTTIVPGQEIGAYRIVEQVGKGGMASVYKAYQASMDRFVAVKIMPFEFAQNEQFIQRFRREVVTIARLEHPHILPVYDSGEHQGAPYLVMRYLDAGTLKQRMSGGRLSLAEIDRIFSQLADALEYAHRHDVVHRDIKPANVMLTSRDDVLLTDFGIAKLLGADTQVTATGALTGTPAYMSPEQGDGREIDHRSDIYSLGIVLYEMITGRVPFEAETPLAVILKHLQAPLPPPSSITDVSPAVEGVTLRALAKDPGDRFPGMADFLAAWRRALRSSELHPVKEAAPEDETLVETPGQAAEEPTYVEPAGETLVEPGQTAARTVQEQPSRGKPRRSSRDWLLFAGAAAVIVFGLCLVGGYFAYRVCCGPNGTIPGILSTDDGGEDGFVQETLPFPVQGGTWESWTGSGGIYAIEVFDGDLYAGGPGGIRVFDPDLNLVRTHTVRDGLPTNEVNDLFYDAGGSGDLWAATFNGVARYDGDRWILYGSDDGLESTDLVSIGRAGDFIAAGGYFEEDGGGIYLFDGTGWSTAPGFDSTLEGSATQFSTTVWDILHDSGSGLTWFATGSGLASWDGELWTRFTTADGLPSDAIEGIAQDGEGRLIVLTDNGAAYLEGAGFTLFSPTEGETIYDFMVDSTGALWFSGSASVLRYTPETGNWDVFESGGDFPAYSVYAMALGEDGSVYFGTDGMGIIAHESNGFTPIEMPAGPEQTASGSILRDPSGSLWFVEKYGLTLDLYDPSENTWSGREFSECCIVPLGFDAGGTLWGGGDTGLWRIGPDGELANWTASDGLPSDQVNDLAVTENQGVWASTDGGLVRIDGGEIAEIVTGADAGVDSDGFQTILVDSAGGLWADAGASSELAYRDPAGDWQVFAPGNPFTEDRGQVEDLAEGADGSIWVASFGDGVFRYLNGSWQHFTPDGGGVLLPSWNVTSVTAAPDGSLWFATTGGAARFDGTAWWSWGLEDGLAHGYVNAIYVMNDGSVWFATDGGITRWEP